jgi:hypothetical protein
LQILWVLHFIAATIEKQQDLGDNWQINVHKNFILYWKQPLFPRPMKTPVKAKNDKAKIRLLQIFWVLHFIAATIENNKTGDNWQINVHKNFILYWKQLFALFPDLWNTVS